jgi:CBS domain containing-hemolysin-like protein
VEEDIQKIGAGHFAVSATTDIEDLGRDLGIILKRGYNTTIGGYIAEKLGVIPDEGKSYEEAGWVFKITRRDTRHILELEVMKKGET